MIELPAGADPSATGGFEPEPGAHEANAATLVAGAGDVGVSQTPLSWRVTAAGLLAGGFSLGLLAATGRARRLLPIATAGVALGSAIPIALASRHPRISPAKAARALAGCARPPTFSIVVGARDEAVALPHLIGDLANQDYRDPDGRPLFEIVVVDDRSTDGTAVAALAAAGDHGLTAVVSVLQRRGPGLADGKGAALTAAQPAICHGDIVAVLDADARLEPQFLRRAAGYFAAGADAVTARRRILGAERGWLEQAQADEQTLDGEINRGRWALGGCSEFRGNGIMIRRSLLADVGGWRASALTEDTDLSSRVAAATGKGVAWAIDVEVWEEPVSKPVALWNQRKRWAEGAIRRYFEHGPAVLRSSALSKGAKLDFSIYATQLTVPPVFVGVAAASLVRGRRKSFVAMLAGYFGVSAVLAWDSLRWSGTDGRELKPSSRARRSVQVTLFNCALARRGAASARQYRPCSGAGPVRQDGPRGNRGARADGEAESKCRRQISAR